MSWMGIRLETTSTISLSTMRKPRSHQKCYVVCTNLVDKIGYIGEARAPTSPPIDLPLLFEYA